MQRCPAVTILIVLAFWAGAHSPSVAADRIIMKDGSVIEGQIFKTRFMHVFIITAEGNKTVPMDRVERIERGGAPDAPPGTESATKPIGPADEKRARNDLKNAIRKRDSFAQRAALGKLAGALETASRKLLVSALVSGAAAGVRAAAAEAMARTADPAGLFVAPLCRVLRAGGDLALREACARALEKNPYKEQAIDALIRVISNIPNTRRDLWSFGANCTGVLDRIAGQSFGAGKFTAPKWQKWWRENRAGIRAGDAKRRAELKRKVKTAAGKPARTVGSARSAPRRTPAAEKPAAPKEPLSAAQRNERAARSLLSLARSWRTNDNHARAAEYLRKLLARYPDAQVVPQAKAMLAEMKP